mgnify:FL=1
MSKKSLHKFILAMVAAGALLPGCAIQQDLQRAKDGVASATQTADLARTSMSANAASGAVTTLSRARIAGEPFVIRVGELPPVFSRPLAWRSHGTESMVDLLRAFTEMTGLPVRKGELSAGAPGGGHMSGVAADAQTAALSSERVTLSFNGTVKSFLDEIASRLDVSWRYDVRTREVELYRFETRAISLFLPPGKKNVSASISLTGGGTSPSGNVSVDHTVSVDPWKSVMSGVGSILGAGGTDSGAQIAALGNGGTAAASGSSLSVNGRTGFAVANPELGIVTITARPATLARVTAYLDSVNKRFAQNVLIDVKVFSVSLDANASAGVSFSFLKQALSKYNLSVVSSDVVRPEVGTPTQLTLDVQGSRGSMMGSVVAEALRQVGNVSLQTQGQVVAVNGQPSPFQQAREFNYVASSTTTTIPNAGVSTTIQPGTRIVGFTANFLPQVLGDNRILLQYQMQMSSLVALRQITAGDSVTQLPEITSQSLQQQAFLRDGQAVLLFGFDQERKSEIGSDGVVSVSRASRNERNLNVVLIQVNTGAKNGEI